MKTQLALVLTAVAWLLGAAGAHAQADSAHYAFSTTTTGSLTDMNSGTTMLVPADENESGSAVTPIGFDFFLMGVRYDRFSVNSDGILRLGGTIVTFGDFLLPVPEAALITAYAADQRTHLTGKVHFKVTGSAPARVLVVEWLHLQADFEEGGTADLTYQVRLSEATGGIEFVYGAMAQSEIGAEDPRSNAPQIGFSTHITPGTVGTIAAPYSGSPAPTYDGVSTTPAVNTYDTPGPIPVLNSAADGSRRTFSLLPPAVAAPGGPLSFTGVTVTSMTLHWTDSANELGYALYVSTDGGASFRFLDSAPQNATSFMASGLKGGTSYTFRVSAFNEGRVASLTGSAATPAPAANSSTGTGGAWGKASTWTAGVPTGDQAVTLAAGTTVTLDADAAAYSLTIAGTGVLQFEPATGRTLTVGSDVTIQAGGTLRTHPEGVATTHRLSVRGNLVNDGTLDLSTNGNQAGAVLVFTGAEDATFSGSGTTTDIRQITLDKGNSPDSVLEITTANFTTQGATTDVAGWLAFANGLLKLSGTFPGTSRVFTLASYTIPSSAGLWLDNPNYTVVGQDGDATVNGHLHVSQGTFGQGATDTNTLGGGDGAIFTLEGSAAVDIAGRFFPTGPLVYNQSGGTLRVAVVGNANGSQSGGVPSFGLGAPEAIFNTTGGTIVLVQAATGDDPVDYFVGSISVPNVGGTLQVGSAATAGNFDFRLSGNFVPNLVIDGTTNGKTAIVTGFVNVLGNTTIQPGASLVADGRTLILTGPTFTNNGTLSATGAGSRFYFDGKVPQTYTGTGAVTAPLANFEVDNLAGVTIDPSVPQPFVVSRINLFNGDLHHADKLTVGNGGTSAGVIQIGFFGFPLPSPGHFDTAPTWNVGTGGFSLIYQRETAARVTGPEVPATRAVDVLTANNTFGVTLGGGDLTVNGTLNLRAGRVQMDGGRLLLGTGGTIVRTAGWVDGRLRIPFAAAGAKTFPVGTANGYSPVVFNATSGSFPTAVTVAAVQSPAPNIEPLDHAIGRYWTLEATGLKADLTFTYLDPADLPATATEANLLVYRHDGSGPASYTNLGGTLDTTANTASVTDISTFSDWTLAEAGATPVELLDFSVR